MNANTITTPDGDSVSGPHPSPSSYPHQHQGYDYSWVPNGYSPDTGTGCETAQKQQQAPHSSQGLYANNITVGSSQQSLTREQYLGQGCPSQQQEGSTVAKSYSHSVYGVYPNQMHGVVSPVQLNPQQQPQPQHLQPQQQLLGIGSNGVAGYRSQCELLSAEQSKPLTPLMTTVQMFMPLQGGRQHHMGNGSADGSTSVPTSVKAPTAAQDNGQGQQCPRRGTVTHSSGIQVCVTRPWQHDTDNADAVCRKDYYQDVDQDYSAKKTCAIKQQPATIDNLLVKPLGSSQVPSKEPTLQVQQLVVNKEAEKLSQNNNATTFKELTSTRFLDASPSVAIACPGTMSEPALVSRQPLLVHASVLQNPSTPQLFASPTVKAQPLPQTHPVASVSPSSVIEPAAPLLSISISNGSQMSHNVSQIPSLASHSQTTAFNNIALLPIEENPDFMDLQVTQPPFSQSAYLTVHPRTSLSAPIQSALISPSEVPSPQTNVSVDESLDNSIHRSFPTSPAVASSSSTASDFSQHVLTAEPTPERPHAVTRADGLSASQGTDHIACNVSEQQTTEKTGSLLKTDSTPEVSWGHHEANARSSVCNWDGQTDSSDNVISCKDEPEKIFLPVAKSGICTSKDQAASGKKRSLKTTWVTETKNNSPLAGCKDGSVNKTSGDLVPGNGQTTDTIRKVDAVDLPTKDCSDGLLHYGGSQGHDSLVDTRQIPQHSSLNEISDKFHKGDTPRRRIATEEQVVFPLLHGWRREIRVRKLDNRLKGETWYYSPCGRRMKQFPEVIKYLKIHEDNLKGVTREHFSFSPRMPVGDFYEERDTPEGKKWFLLANEEVPSIIMAITGRRGRPPNPDKEAKPQSRAFQRKGVPRRRPGRPPKLKMVDLLSKIDARLLKRLEAQEELTEEDKIKLDKIKKKMKKKARIKRREDANNRKIRQLKKKAKLDNDRKTAQKDQAQSVDRGMYQCVSPELKKPGYKRKVSGEQCVEKVYIRRIAGARCKALAKTQAEAEAKAALAAKRQAERRARAKKHVEEKKRQQKIIEELKKPNEDMCLIDHMPLPELCRIPGLVLSGDVFSHCITVVEFLHIYGKVLGLQVPKDIPSLAMLQEGLLGLGKSQSKLLDLLINLVSAVLHNPRSPSNCQSVKLLGEKLTDLELRPSTVSEVLRVFLETHGFEKAICNSLRTKCFQTLSPEVKAFILAFLVEELNGSNLVINEIDKTMENIVSYKKNRWITEVKLRKMKATLASKTSHSEVLCLEERRRSARISIPEDGPCANRSARRRKGRLKSCEVETLNNASVPELERQIDKLTKRQEFFRKKLLQSSHCMRALLLGQDRYQRRYWLLPNIGGVLVEGPEEILASGDSVLMDEPKPCVNKEVTSSVKVDHIVEPQPPPLPNATITHQPFSPSISSPTDVAHLPGEASLMCSPRGWGRPRKIRPEVELHLRSVKNRRQRHSKSGAENSEAGRQSKHFMKEDRDSRQLFADGSCKDESLYGPESTVTSCVMNSHLPLAAGAHVKPVPLPKNPRSGRRRRKGCGAEYRSFEAAAVKHRGRPPASSFQEIEQKYLNQLVAKPIPQEMLKGWWWIRKPEELRTVLTALHPLGIRERVLRKNLTKHMEFMTECCAQRTSDPLFYLKVEDIGPLLEAVKQPWVEQSHAMQIDIGILKMVEDLERRVLGADLQLKGFTAPEPDSTRADLLYHEHELDPKEDWMLKSKKECWDLFRAATNPLDLAVVRLANLERNIERRYLKAPLWNFAEVMRLAPLTSTPGEEEATMDFRILM